MKTARPGFLDTASLRQLAEERLKNKPSETTSASAEFDAQKLIHELQVHQLELEMQNEELLLANAAAQDAIELYDFAPTGYYTISNESEIFKSNLSGAALLGKERSSLNDCRFSSFISTESKQVFYQFLERVFSSKSRESCEVVLEAEANHPTYVHITGIVNGNAQLCLLTVTDISEHKNLEALNEVLLSSLPYPAMYIRKKDMVVLAVNKFASAMGVRVGGQCWREFMKTEYISDRDKAIAGRFPGNVPADFHIRCTFCMADKCFASALEQSDHAVNAFDAVWDTYWIRVSSEVFLHYAVNISERKLAEDQIRLAHERLRRFVDSDIVGIIIADSSGNIIESNDYYLNIIGYNRSDFEKGKVNWREITPPEWLYTDEKAIIELRETGKCTPYEKEYIRKDGSRIYVMITDAILPGPDEQIAGFVLDITKRKQAEKDLQESEKKYRELIENSPDAIIIYSNGEIIMVNRASVHLMAADSPGELLGKPVLQFVHPDNKTVVIERMGKMAEDGIVLPINEERFICCDGSEVDVEVKAMPLMFENKKAVQLIIRDISDRKQAEKKLNESQERLKKSQEIAHLGSWELDIETQKLLWSDEVYRILGLQPQEFVVTLEIYLEMLHPDDRDMVAKAYFSSIEEGRDGYEIEHRVIRKHTGEIRYVLEKCEHIRDNSGKITRSVGMVHDITERKQAEIVLSRKDKLMEITGSTAKVGGWELDVETLKQVWTDEVYRLHEIDLSFKPDYENAKDFFAPGSKLIVENAVQQSIENGTDFDIEVELITHKGTHKWVRSIGKSYRENGKTIKVFGSIQDISERKQLEIAIRESEAHYRLLTEDVTDVVWKQDSNNRFTYVSPADERLRGFKAEEMLGHHVFDILTDEGIAVVKEKTRDRQSSRKDAEGNNTITFEVQQRCKNGSLVWTEVISTAEYGADGSISGYHGISRNISNRKKADEAIRKSEERYRFMFDNSPQPMYIFDVETLAFLEANEAFVNHYGYSREELLQMNINDIRPPEDIPRLLKDVADSRQSNTIRGEWRHVRKNGDPIIVEITSQPINYNGREARHILIKDITERRKAEKELMASEVKFRELFESNSDGIVIFSLGQDGAPSLILDLNENAARMVGLTKEEYWIAEHTEFEKDITKEDLDWRKNELITKGFLNFETIILHKDGHKLDVEIKIMLIKYNNQPALMNIVRDITDRKNAEIQLQVYAIELSKQIAEKNKFFSIIAHDLRGPFNGFLGLTQIMTERISELTMDEVQQMAMSMKVSANNLFRLLENLLHWARIEQGLIPFSPKQVQLHLLTNECMAMAYEPAIKKGIELNCSVSEKIDVFADTNMLQAIIRNLISNAVKYTSAGGTINLTAQVYADKSVEISVQDSGIGMSASMQESLFHLNVQNNRKGTAGEPSTGLGLIICREFIEKHGGELNIESEVGKGSIFRFILPCNSPEQEKEVVLEKNPAKAEKEPVKGLKILIAEDDDTSEMLISIALRSVSREILKVSTGADAVEMCRNNPDIDLIMMDIKMPVLNGDEATLQIREFNKKVVIIAQTAFGNNSDRELASELGFNDYISKPLSVNLLKDTIQKHFGV